MGIDGTYSSVCVSVLAWMMTNAYEYSVAAGEI